MARYKAVRSLHYINVNGESVVVDQDDWVRDASDGQIQEWLAEGYIRESRAKE